MSAANPTTKRQPEPFAALPHHIASDPRLTPTDVRVLLALLFWARNKLVCWPSDRSIGERTGRSMGTVQRSLRKLEALGLIARDPSPENVTGRIISLRWKSPSPSHEQQGDELQGIPYGDYLASAEWAVKRDHAIRLAGGRCAVCNSGKSLQVHHRTYDRIGNELPSDLLVLCKGCHELFHTKIPRP